MDWEKARAQHPEAENYEHQVMMFTLKTDPFRWIEVVASEDQRFVERITTGDFTNFAVPPITAGEVVARYGLPCKVTLYYDKTTYSAANHIMFLSYPTLGAMAAIDVPFGVEDRPRPDAPVVTFGLSTEYAKNACVISNTAQTAQWTWETLWRGFASVDLYLADYRRIFGETP
jgi:hypothetical protein